MSKKNPFSMEVALSPEQYVRVKKNGGQAYIRLLIDLAIDADEQPGDAYREMARRHYKNRVSLKSFERAAALLKNPELLRTSDHETQEQLDCPI